MTTLRPSAAAIPRSAFAGFRFPSDVIVVAVRWYLRFGLSYRDVEELLTERGVEEVWVRSLGTKPPSDATPDRAADRGDRAAPKPRRSGADGHGDQHAGPAEARGLDSAHRLELYAPGLTTMLALWSFAPAMITSPPAPRSRPLLRWFR